MAAPQGEQAELLTWSEGGVCPGVRLEGLGWSARPFGDAPCRGQAQSPAFAPGYSEVAAGVLVFL